MHGKDRLLLPSSFDLNNPLFQYYRVSCFIAIMVHMFTVTPNPLSISLLCFLYAHTHYIPRPFPDYYLQLYYSPCNNSCYCLPSKDHYRKHFLPPGCHKRSFGNFSFRDNPIARLKGILFLFKNRLNGLDHHMILV